MKTKMIYVEPEMKTIVMKTIGMLAASGQDTGSNPGGSDWEEEEEG